MDPNEQPPDAVADDGTPLVKVLVEYLDQGSENSERLWAEPLADDLYEIRNTPWYLYKLNWGDIVRCAEVSADEVPRVVEVVERSGHRTLRILFNEKRVSPEEQEAILAGLNDLEASYERHSDTFVSVDVEPEADYEAIFALLARHTEAESLVFEEAWRDDDHPGFGPPYDDTQPDPTWLEDA